MRVTFSNYAQNINNKSNTHTTTLIDMHNRMKHANTRNNNIMLEILFNAENTFSFHHQKSIVSTLFLQKKKYSAYYNHRNLNKVLLFTPSIIRLHSLAYLISQVFHTLLSSMES